ncbi:hypothetical protein [Defluviimonas sp. WL0075]|uniref:Uncharacterized protein n=1 Tax=Albidovulum sediminicola TaxID=2984331 RepID=A0ABT2Z6W2_9RHOB|nr:hypothetical protein [Defluviimonas sp. WL0075]MCV2866816.1 hypothetical protein [Defluviimonas sp. WL0075]
MKQGSLPFLPSNLKAPLRDVLRAVSGVAELSEQALEPVAQMLPEPLRKAVRDSLHSIKDATRRDYVSRMDRGKLAIASRFLQGQGDPAEGAAAAAKMLGFAWDYLCEHAAHTRGWMYSEASAAGALRKLGADPEPGRVYQAVMSGAIGHLPGAPLLAAQAGAAPPASLVAASILWLLTMRMETAEEELHLLDMALALGRAAHLDDLDQGDSDAMGARLRSLAQHL